MSVASSFAAASESSLTVASHGPFYGLVVCVTGLSKGIFHFHFSSIISRASVRYYKPKEEARKHVMEAAKRLGGQYSPSLHPQCTHLVVQSLGGRKLEHALTHGIRNGLLVVTLGWFVDSVSKNVRLSEAAYCVQSVTMTGIYDKNSCHPDGLKHMVRQHEVIEDQWLHLSDQQCSRSMSPCLSGHSLYIDPDISVLLQSKVADAAVQLGAILLKKWFAGCGANYVVCEGSSLQKYLGHADNMVTRKVLELHSASALASIPKPIWLRPQHWQIHFLLCPEAFSACNTFQPIWVLKTAERRSVQRFVRFSADLARHVGMLLENLLGNVRLETVDKWDQDDAGVKRNEASCVEREQIVKLAKVGVRNRRLLSMQTCQVPLHLITPSCLLDSICWSISEPSCTASIYEGSSWTENVIEAHRSMAIDADAGRKDLEISFSNFSRALTESEKNEVMFKHHFLTILFPVDRFAEMGPSARSFFSDKGFTCLHLLDLIYTFYQESMSYHEVEVAIHTGSRHADRLRSIYSGDTTAESGGVTFKRIDFVGSRRSFEKLKRVSGENSTNVYELVIGA